MNTFLSIFLVLLAFGCLLLLAGALARWMEIVRDGSSPHAHEGSTFRAE